MTAPAAPSTIDPGNEAMAQFWTGERGAAWVERHEAYDAQLGPYTEALVAELEPSGAEAVLDVGCGTGFTTRAMARPLGHGGAVGLDLSPTMVKAARAGAPPTSGLRFEVADAQVANLRRLNDGRAFDVVCSRFGVMFFADPAAAFANLLAGAAPGARMGFVCWAALEHNPWFTSPQEALDQLLEPVTDLPEPVPPDAPGPFSMAPPGRAEELLGRAGWEEAASRTLNSELYVGGPGTVDDVVAFLLTGSVLRSVLSRHPHLAAPAQVALSEALAPHHDGRGVRFGARVHLVTAQAP
ncbi:MAG: class I SAM-dependent methyltransferase [Microthrixaceae bacterium]